MVMLRHLPAWAARTGLNQAQIADRLQVSQGTVSKWFRGAQGMSVEQFQRLAEVCGVTPLDLLLEPPSPGEPPRSHRLLHALALLSGPEADQVIAIAESLASKAGD